MKHLVILFACIFIIALSCQKEPFADLSSIDEYLEQLPASAQRSGDIALGMQYLLYGDYVDGGLPIDIFNSTAALAFELNNELGRTGDNEEIPYSYSAVDAANGVRVVSPNCMQCHADYVNGDFVLGLGNTSFDFTIDQSSLSAVTDLLISNQYGIDSPEWDAYSLFARAINTTSGKLTTATVGANPADKLAVILAAHRDKDDLTWRESPAWPIPEEVIPADVPAWWLLKKKNAMFSSGIGRGDFARIMMASSVLTLQDSTKAREVDTRFADVLAFINSLEPPKFPGTVDQEKATKGEALYMDNCAKCHGTYGSNESYPNFLVDHELIQTDPNLATSNYAYDAFGNWYNTSWFSKEPNGAKVVLTNGYVAPPLDGIWATAPYLHNGSVPSLEDLLNSDERPSYWDRPQTNDSYDLEKVGISYVKQSEKVSGYTYDVTLKGYGNTGHYFGDHLSKGQRAELIEYLKTL